jgi:flavodoxin
MAHMGPRPVPSPAVRVCDLSIGQAKESLMMTRRQSLAIGLGTSLGFLAARADSQQVSGHGRTLVAFFTRSGNTKLIAGKVRRDLGADLFEIQPAQAYPEDYEATVAQAEREKQSGYEPPLKENVAEIGMYNTVYLGFPIWGSTAPTIIKSFLSKHDLAGKDVVPLITHGGYGAGDSLGVLRRMAPKARLSRPFIIRMDQERAILKEVANWLQTSGARK